MKSNNKKSCQFDHAIKRAKQRYNLSLSKEDYLTICKMIQNNQGTYLGKQSNRVSVWVVNYQKQDLTLVYDKERHVIATFLPANLPANKIFGLQ